MFECKGCQKRHIGCHGKCESYQSEKAKCEAVREKRMRDNEIYYAILASNRRGQERARKKKRGGL